MDFCNLQVNYKTHVALLKYTTSFSLPFISKLQKIVVFGTTPLLHAASTDTIPGGVRVGGRGFATSCYAQFI